MILSRDDFFISESKKSTKELKKTLRGTLSRADRAMLRKVLRHNIVTFKFVKRDESLRRAKGTLYPSYLPPLRGGAPKPEHQFVYYDLDKHHWRSFRSFSFIKIVDIKPISSRSMTSRGEELEAEDDEEMRRTDREVDLEKEEKKKEETKEAEKEKKHKEREKEEEERKKHSESDEESDEKKKTYKAGEKIPEKELMRRSSDFRKGTKKNKTTKEANDKFKSGELDDEPKEKKEEKHSEKSDEHKHKEEKKEEKHKDKKDDKEERED